MYKILLKKWILVQVKGRNFHSKVQKTPRRGKKFHDHGKKKRRSFKSCLSISLLDNGILGDKQKAISHASFYFFLCRSLFWRDSIFHVSLLAANVQNFILPSALTVLYNAHLHILNKFKFHFLFLFVFSIQLMVAIEPGFVWVWLEYCNSNCTEFRLIMIGFIQQ